MIGGLLDNVCEFVAEAAKVLYFMIPAKYNDRLVRKRTHRPVKLFESYS
jgi:hypothetical protein